MKLVLVVRDGDLRAAQDSIQDLAMLERPTYDLSSDKLTVMAETATRLPAERLAGLLIVHGYTVELRWPDAEPDGQASEALPNPPPRPDYRRFKRHIRMQRPDIPDRIIRLVYDRRYGG